MARIASGVLHEGLKPGEVVGGWGGSAWCVFVRIESGIAVKRGMENEGYLGPIDLIR